MKMSLTHQIQMFSQWLVEEQEKVLRRLDVLVEKVALKDHQKWWEKNIVMIKMSGKKRFILVDLQLLVSNKLRSKAI